MDLHALRDEHCQPLRGEAARLPATELDAALAQLAGWQCIEDGRAIAKTFRFPDYYRSLAFVNALAFVAHREDHHPDLGVHYDRVVVRYSTHDAGGLTRNDLVCAVKADALYAQSR